jgi:hypothetical protein
MREIEVVEDALDDGRIGEGGQDPHVSTTTRAQEWQHLKDPGKELGPADAGGAARRP